MSIGQAERVSSWAMSDDTTPWYIVATDDGQDEAYAATRKAGLELARADGAGVILYDRTSESYLTNPYPAGPWSSEDDAVSPGSELEPQVLENLGRGYLARQLSDARDSGLPAKTHLAVNTGAEALTDALERYQPAKVILPSTIIDEGGFLDRVRHSTISDLLAHTDVEAILVEPDGSIREDG